MPGTRHPVVHGTGTVLLYKALSEAVQTPNKDPYRMMHGATEKGNGAREAEPS
jgi:hypothetical protein